MDNVLLHQSQKMTMHWGKTLGSKNTNIFKPHVKSENHSVGFPFNATKYRNSQEKLLWDQIWDEAMNHSLANRNSTYMQNVYMQKTRLLEDMLDHKVHPHSFTMVMVIASMFLFFTLAITIAVVAFCRKKNMVFAFQKSEQEDDGEYELDDLDTNTDMEYGSDNDDDIESGSPKKHYGQYLQVNNPAASPLKPLMCVNNNNSSMVNSTREEQTSQPSPIYRPKRPLHSCDNRGAYQAINVTTSHLDMCNETSSNTLNDKFVLTTDVADSPTVSIKKSLLCVKKPKSNNNSSSNSSNMRDGIANRVADGAVSSKCYNGDIPVISIPSRDQLSNTDNHSCSNNVPSKEAQCKYQVNHKSGCIKSKAASNDMIEETIQDSNTAKHCQLTHVANCDKYDTEISLLDNNLDSKNSTKKNYTEIAIVRLTSKSKSVKNREESGQDTEPLISPSPRNSPCNKVVLNDNRKASQSEDIYSHAITTSSLQLCNDEYDAESCDEERYVRCTSNGQLSLQASPVKESQVHKCLYNHGGCQSLPSTPHDEAKTQGSVLKQLRQQWVTFDDALH